ncbi:MAG: peptidoglycan DD-metalloendopeptidase family protein [Chloroflexi bacterium]|nr:peptidoglycan DD-metalloendopeptidase family protein [Chloroflexota bacterium]
MTIVTHGLVLPEENSEAWRSTAKRYQQAFPNLDIVLGVREHNLNRYRDITTIATAGWLNDDPLHHIQLVFRNVVRTDIIAAQTIAEFQAILDARAAHEDRFGALLNEDGHLRERFSIDWPSDANPARILRGFYDGPEADLRHIGIDIGSSAGSTIRAAAAGVVAHISRQEDGLGFGAYAQIVSRHDGKAYTLSYTQLDSIHLNLGEEVAAGQAIAHAAGERFTLICQSDAQGGDGFHIPNVIDPTPLLHWSDLIVRTTGVWLRIRSAAGTEHPQLDSIRPGEVAITLEPHGETLQKLGVEDSWLHVANENGTEGYAAARYLEARRPVAPPEGPPATQNGRQLPKTNITGVNLDIHNPRGRPDPARLGRIGWVRVKYNVSYDPKNRSYGNRDLEAAYERHFPVFERYVREGAKLIVIFTHQLYGEGANYYWPDMAKPSPGSTSRWTAFTPHFAEMAGRAAAQFASSGIVSAYQIWNEQDTFPAHARAAVPIPPYDYAKLFAATYRAIRAQDSQVHIISGGHITGAGAGVTYARKTRDSLPDDVRPDGLAFHAYGLGIGREHSPYSIWGKLSDAISSYDTVYGNVPLYITEWGVLDRQYFDETEAVTTYARQFMSVVEANRARVVAACWYGWGHGMDNGYGLVNFGGHPNQPLYEYLTNFRLG